MLPDEREIYPEWFQVEEADECDDVPESVNTGKPRDLCTDVSERRVDDHRYLVCTMSFLSLYLLPQDDLDRRFCICLKRPGRPTAYHVPGYGTTHSEARYEPVCGQCRDPCALRFVPDSYPRRDSSEESSEEDRNNGGGGRGRN